MTIKPTLRIVPLNDGHQRTAFSSGDSEIDRYLHQQAGQDLAKKVASVYVLSRIVDPTVVLGFYTLSASTIELQDVPILWQRRLPRYPDVPVALLGRLGVAQSAQRQGWGTLLVADAMKRTVRLSGEIGLAGMIVDAQHASLCAFYEALGFRSLSANALRMFIPFKLMVAATRIEDLPMVDPSS